MKYSIILAGAFIAFMSTGCMSDYYVRHERARYVEEDSLQPPPMTVDDVIALAKDSVGDDVIIAQMKATDSYFKLTNDDIRDLKKNGVTDKVISAMIKSGNEPKPAPRRMAYYPYPDYYYWYPSPYFYGAWYSPAYFAFNYHYRAPIAHVRIGGMRIGRGRR